MFFIIPVLSWELDIRIWKISGHQKIMGTFKKIGHKSACLIENVFHNLSPKLRWGVPTWFFIIVDLDKKTKLEIFICNSNHNIMEKHILPSVWPKWVAWCPMYHKLLQLEYHQLANKLSCNCHISGIRPPQPPKKTHDTIVPTSLSFWSS